MKKIQSSISVRVLEFLGAFFMCGILVVVFADVFARYFFRSPIGGAAEIVAFFMGFTVFAAFPLITRDREHITAGILEKIFKGAGRYIQRLARNQTQGRCKVDEDLVGAVLRVQTLTHCRVDEPGVGPALQRDFLLQLASKNLICDGLTKN